MTAGSGFVASIHSPWTPAGDAIQVAEAPAESAEVHAAVTAPAVTPTNDFRGAVAAYERDLLEDALRRNRFNQRATAAALGLSYDQLRHALKRHKLLDAAA